MAYTQTHASAWTKLGYDGRSDRFHLAFKLGPYKLARAALDVTIVDLGKAAISSEDSRLPPLQGQELLLRSVPDDLSLASLCRDGDGLVYPFYRYDRCWVATEDDFERYLASFSKTSRKGLKRQVKKLVSASGGNLDIRHFGNADAMDAYYSEARAISSKTFQERLMDDGLPADNDFRQSMLQQALLGRCYGSILYLDDQPISYLHCQRQGAGWMAVYGGFDPAYAKLSPGTVHLVSILERSFEDQDCELFDFGPGHCDYKPFFATHAVSCSDILVLRKSLRNRLIVGAHQALAQITDRGLDLADLLQLKTVLRQKIRGR